MVRVSDAIGVIAIPGLQITVKPKIPLGHLLHMFAKVDVWPRLDEQRTEIEQSTELFELITRWFLSAAEQLLRLGLIRDYEPERQELPAVRGRLEPLNTSSFTILVVSPSIVSTRTLHITLPSTVLYERLLTP